MAKICVFCRNPVRDVTTGRSRAREHVFASWALRELGVEKESISFSRFEKLPSSLQLSEPPPDTIRTLTLDKFLLGHVCNRCNNGWMSALERATQPFLRKLLKNQAHSIEPEIRPAFAKWAVKTIGVLTAYLNPPVNKMPLGHMQALVGDRLAIPKGIDVFHRQSDYWRMHFASAASWTIQTEEANKIIQQRYKSAYKWVFQIGHAQFLVQYFPDSNAKVTYDPRFLTLLSRSPQASKARIGVPLEIGDDLFSLIVGTEVLTSSEVPMRHGRNDLCGCGSGIKFKRCHGASGTKQLRPQIQGWDGEFMTGEDFEARIRKEKLYP